MSLKSLIQRQKPLTISVISFLLMLAVVVIVGLVGGVHIIDYLQRQLVRHGIDHNQEVIAGMEPLLERSLQDGVAPETIVAKFQGFIDHAGPFGVRLFLIDRKAGTVIADSQRDGKLPYPVAHLLKGPLRQLNGAVIRDPGRWSGNAWRGTERGAVELFSLRKLSVPNNMPNAWTLGVSSDLSELFALMDALHLHLDAVLLVTYGLIGLLGFLVLRWVGRRYESGLEQQVAARTRELEQAHASLLDQARLVTIGQTASVLAHEMRNPLASIKLALSGVSRGDGLSAREKQRVELVVGEVDRLEAMLSETLDYAKPVAPDRQPMTLDALLDGVLELEARLFAEKQLKLIRETCPSCPSVRVDSEKMRQALLNLLKNAREASPEGGEVRIVLRMANAQLLLSISNQGEALDEAVRKHAYDFFFTTKSRGTGLGLGLVKHVVEAHGGSVALHGDAGLITAAVSLPIAASNEA